MRTKVLACLLAGAASLVGMNARAQSAGGAWVQTRDGGWVWYNRASAWSGYAPGGYVQPSESRAVTVVAPSGPSATTGSGWQGYNPGISWRGYSPATMWQEYRPAPTASGEMFTFRAGELGIYSNRTVAIAPSSYRELGTGRNVPLAKPWLSNSAP